MSNSILSRFVASLFNNILRSGISFLTGMLVARWLGPLDYGRLAFLLASFTSFQQLWDMASSSAFFTFLSQKQRSRQFVSFYWRWIGMQFLLSFLLVGVLLPETWMYSIWIGEERFVILLAFVAAFMQGVVWPIASQMAEAQRQTMRVQLINTVLVTLHLGVVLGLWFAGKVAIPLLLGAMAIEWGLAGWYAARLYKSRNEEDVGENEITDTASSVWKEFYRYCLPFVPYVWLGFAQDFFDRWMLQRWGGSTEQAFYAVANQVAVIVLLATTSILRIFWKEIAEAYHQQDLEKMRDLYYRVSRGLFFVGAVVAGGLIPWAGEIIYISLGSAYVGGTITLAMMFFFPVFQSLGQICATMFYATGKTRIQVTVGMSFMVAGIIVTYLMLAPPDAIVPGFGLSSRGLVFKVILLTVISVNIQNWIIARIFGWHFKWLYQVAGLTIAVLAGWLVKYVTTGLLPPAALTTMIVSSCGYLALMLGLAYAAPWMAGTSREEIRNVVTRRLCRP